MLIASQVFDSTLKPLTSSQTTKKTKKQHGTWKEIQYDFPHAHPALIYFIFLLFCILVFTCWLFLMLMMIAVI